MDHEDFIEELNALIAATYAGGNSFAARSARARAQRRDRFGRFAEMFGLMKFKLRLGKEYGSREGEEVNVQGVYVGAGNTDTSGWMYVQNDPNVPDGFYDIEGNNFREVLASLDADYLAKRGIELGKDAQGNAVGKRTLEQIPSTDRVGYQVAPPGFRQHPSVGGAYISDDGDITIEGDGQGGWEVSDNMDRQAPARPAANLADALEQVYEIDKTRSNYEPAEGEAPATAEAPEAPEAPVAELPTRKPAESMTNSEISDEMAQFDRIYGNRRIADDTERARFVELQDEFDLRVEENEDTFDDPNFVRVPSGEAPEAPVAELPSGAQAERAGWDNLTNHFNPDDAVKFLEDKLGRSLTDGERNAVRNMGLPLSAVSPDQLPSNDDFKSLEDAMDQNGVTWANVEEGSKASVAELPSDADSVEKAEADIQNSEQVAEETADPETVDAAEEIVAEEAPVVEQATIKPPRSPREPSIGAFTGRMAAMLDGVTDPKQVQDIINGEEITYIDFETSGFSAVPGDGALNRPLQMGIVKVRNGEVVDRKNLWMNPEMELSQWSRDNLKDADGNPLTDEWLAQQPSMQDALTEAVAFIGPDAILGGQNVQFDLEVLMRSLKEQGIDFSFAGTIDSRDLGKKTLPTWTPESPVGPTKTDAEGNVSASNSLGDLISFLQGEGYDLSLDNWHSADADAQATHELVQALLQRAVDNNVDMGVLTDKAQRDAESASEWADYNAQYEQYVADLSDYFDQTNDPNKEERLALALPLSPEGFGLTNLDGRARREQPNREALIQQADLANLSDEELQRRLEEELRRSPKFTPLGGTEQITPNDAANAIMREQMRRISERASNRADNGGGNQPPATPEATPAEEPEDFNVLKEEILQKYPVNLVNGPIRLTQVAYNDTRDFQEIADEIDGLIARLKNSDGSRGDIVGFTKQLSLYKDLSTPEKRAEREQRAVDSQQAQQESQARAEQSRAEEAQRYQKWLESGASERAQELVNELRDILNAALFDGTVPDGYDIEADPNMYSFERDMQARLSELSLVDGVQSTKAMGDIAKMVSSYQYFGSNARQNLMGALRQRQQRLLREQNAPAVMDEILNKYDKNGTARKLYESGADYDAIADALDAQGWSDGYDKTYHMANFMERSFKPYVIHEEEMRAVRLAVDVRDNNLASQQEDVLADKDTPEFHEFSRQSQAVGAISFALGDQWYDFMSARDIVFGDASNVNLESLIRMRDAIEANIASDTGDDKNASYTRDLASDIVNDAIARMISDKPELSDSAEIKPKKAKDAKSLAISTTTPTMNVATALADYSTNPTPENEKTLIAALAEEGSSADAFNAKETHNANKPQNIVADGASNNGKTISERVQVLVGRVRSLIGLAQEREEVATANGDASRAARSRNRALAFRALENYIQNRAASDDDFDGAPDRDYILNAMKLASATPAANGKGYSEANAFYTAPNGVVYRMQWTSENGVTAYVETVPDELADEYLKAGESEGGLYQVVAGGIRLHRSSKDQDPPAPGIGIEYPFPIYDTGTAEERRSISPAIIQITNDRYKTLGSAMHVFASAMATAEGTRYVSSNWLLGPGKRLLLRLHGKDPNMGPRNMREKMLDSLGAPTAKALRDLGWNAGGTDPASNFDSDNDLTAGQSWWGEFDRYIDKPYLIWARHYYQRFHGDKTAKPGVDYPASLEKYIKGRTANQFENLSLLDKFHELNYEGRDPQAVSALLRSVADEMEQFPFSGSFGVTRFSSAYASGRGTTSMSTEGLESRRKDAASRLTQVADWLDNNELDAPIERVNYQKNTFLEFDPSAAGGEVAMKLLSPVVEHSGYRGGKLFPPVTPTITRAARLLDSTDQPVSTEDLKSSIEKALRDKSDDVTLPDGSKMKTPAALHGLAMRGVNSRMFAAEILDEMDGTTERVDSLNEYYQMNADILRESADTGAREDTNVDFFRTAEVDLENWYAKHTDQQLTDMYNQAVANGEDSITVSMSVGQSGRYGTITATVSLEDFAAESRERRGLYMTPENAERVREQDSIEEERLVQERAEVAEHLERQEIIERLLSNILEEPAQEPKSFDKDDAVKALDDAEDGEAPLAPEEVEDIVPSAENGFGEVTDDPSEVDLSDVLGPDIIDPNLVLDAIENNYPGSERRGNEVLLRRIERVDPKNGNRLVYEFVVTRTPDEYFYMYLREINLTKGTAKSTRVGGMRQSARALNNQIVQGVAEALSAPSLGKYMRSGRRRTRIKDDSFNNDTQQWNHNWDIKNNPQTRRNIMRALDNSQLSSVAVGAIIEYLSRYRGDPAWLQRMVNRYGQRYGFTMQDIYDVDAAYGRHLSNFNAFRTFGTWVSDDQKTPVDAGDTILHTPTGRRGTVIRRVTAMTASPTGYGNYTYTDYVLVRWGNGERSTWITSRNASIISTSDGTDGSERRDYSAPEAPIQVATPEPSTALNLRPIGYEGPRGPRPIPAPIEHDGPDTTDLSFDDESNLVTSEGEVVNSLSVSSLSANATTPAVKTKVSDLRAGDTIETYDAEAGKPTVSQVTSVSSNADGASDRTAVEIVTPKGDGTAQKKTLTFAGDDTETGEGPSVSARRPAEPSTSAKRFAEFTQLFNEGDTSNLDEATLNRMEDVAWGISEGSPAEIEDFIQALRGAPASDKTPDQAKILEDLADDYARSGDEETADEIQEVADAIKIQKSRPSFGGEEVAPSGGDDVPDGDFDKSPTIEDEFMSKPETETEADGGDGGNEEPPTAPAEEQPEDSGEPKKPITVKTTDEDFADEKFPPTEQQRSIIDAVLSGLNVAVQALAGTGKTTTLQLLARQMAKYFPNKKITYIAFNKSVEMEAKRKFGPNVQVMTFDALGWNGISKDITDKAKKLGGMALTNAMDIAGHFNIKPVRAEGEQPGLDQRDTTKRLMKAINLFTISEDSELSMKHLDEAGFEGYSEDVKKQLLENAKDMWDDLSSPYQANTQMLKFTPSHATKLWALSNPDLSKVTPKGVPTDVIFFDEAQDINPVMAKVIRDQSAQKIYVGDGNQAIYGFRGATNELENVEVDVELPLTQSFRFGSKIAGMGNRFLSLVNSRYRVTGAGPVEGEIIDAGTMTDPDAVIVRSNAGALTEIIGLLEAGKKVGVFKKFKDDLQRNLDAARALMAGRTSPNMGDFEGYKSWEELSKDVKDGKADQRATMYYNLIERNGIGGVQDAINRTIVLTDGPEAESGGTDTSPGVNKPLAQGAFYDIVDNGNGTFDVSTHGDTFSMKDLFKSLGMKWDADAKRWTTKGANEDQLKELVSGLLTNKVDLADGIKVENGASGDFVAGKGTYKVSGSGDEVRFDVLEDKPFALKAIKDKLKAAGARWDGTNKNWYFSGSAEDIQKALDTLRAGEGRMFLEEGAEVEKPDVVVLTAHLSKGLEFKRVKIGNDFRGPDVDENGETQLPNPEEIRLAYVAVTRAQEVLDPGSLAWVLGSTTDADESPNAVPSETPETQVEPAQQRTDELAPIDSEVDRMIQGTQSPSEMRQFSDTIERWLEELRTSGNADKFRGTPQAERLARKMAQLEEAFKSAGLEADWDRIRQTLSLLFGYDI